VLAPAGAATAQDLVSSVTITSVVNRTVNYQVIACNYGTTGVNNVSVGLWWNRATAPTCPPWAAGEGPNATWSVNLAAGACSAPLTGQQTNTPDGTYTAWSKADSMCTIAEADENNNASVSAPYTVRPDLMPFNLTATVAGTTVTYQARVINVAASTTTPFSVGLYYDRTTAPTCSDTPNFTWTVPGGLGYMNQVILPQHVRTGAPTGTFTAWVLADRGCAITESREDNNTASRSYTVGPDIRVFTPSVTVNGSTVTYQVTVRNEGSVATGAFTVALYYNRASSPPCGTAADYTWNVASLAPGAFTSLSYVRSNVQGGSYTAWVFADPGCTLPESNETNNIASRNYTVTPPNFYIQSFTATVVGTQVTYSVTVCNSGAGTAIPFTVGLVYNSSTGPTCGTTFDYAWPAVNGLASGACTPALTYARPDVVPPGNYLAWARADSGCAVTESDENNNNASASYAIAPTSPDLYIASFTAVPSGTTVVYTALVCNAGISTSGSVVVGFYWNRNSAPACGDAPDTTVTTAGVIVGGGCVNVSYTRNGVAPGTYNGWGFADSSCAIGEYNENNNTASGQYTVVPPAQPNLIATVLDVTAVGSTVTYQATICNQGAAAAAASTVGLWYNRGTAPNCLDAPDANASVGALAVGGCETKTWTQNNVGPGTYTAWALADTSCTVAESNESDNTTSKQYTVQALPPDAGVPDVLPAPDTKPPADMPKTEGPKPGDGPKAEAPKPGDGPKAEAPKPGDGPKAEAPKPGDGPKAEAPKPGDGPKAEAPKPGDGPKGDGPQAGDGPKGDGPQAGDGVKPDGAVGGEGGPKPDAKVGEGGPAPAPSSGCCRVSQAQTADPTGTAFLALLGVGLVLALRRRRR
jgi:MYXO-CTERM domain-containing protein